MRDALCSKDKLEETIRIETEDIGELEEKIASVQRDIENGIQRYPRKNKDVIYNVKKDSFQTIYKLIRAEYSYGMNCEELEEIYLKGINFVRDIGYEGIGYVNFYNFFSIGILLEADDDKMNEMVQAADGQEMDDILFDFLVHFCNLKRNMVSTSFQKERPYMELVGVIETAISDRTKASALLCEYIKKKWLQGHRDYEWHTAHKRFGYVGLWSFEAAAVSKILNLDDHGIKDNNHYPYDLVHYKDSRKYVVTVPKIVRKEENNVPIRIGIHKNRELEQIIPPRFHELVNQIIIDYEELEDKEIWKKYGLKRIWFTVEAFTKEKQQAPLLGTIIINQLVDRQYVLQLDWKDDIKDYVDNIADFWEGKELKLINFDLRNDQYYYARIPKTSTLRFVYEASITEVDIE